MRYIFILLALLCASCGTALPTIKPYKLDIQQGNVVTSKMLLQLRPGMTKSQVRFIMGTPLIQDSFHGNRWDYVYQMRESGKLKEQRRVILDFENELLKSVRGDVVAAGSELAKDNQTEAPSGTRVVTPIKAAEEKGLLDKLKFWQGEDKAAEKESTDQAAQAKPASEQANKTAAPAVVVPELQPPESKSKLEPVNNEPASILAVPMDHSNSLPSIATAPAVEATQAVAPVAEAQQSAAAATEIAPAIVPMVLDPVAPTEQVVAPAVLEPTALAVEPVPAQPPANPYHYQSPAGMQFDRKIQIEDEEPQSVVEPSGARSGNKVAPKPKQLPQEKDPSFFDRMLEQIGF
jgi:outer membrane protein assembly factor BamE